MHGLYLGQKTPENKAELFAPGIVNDGISTRDITFTPDGKEIYFCKNIGNFSFSTILFCKETVDGWTNPEVVWFAQNPEFIYIEPHISSDGSKLFFVSNQGNEISPANRFVTDIWVSDRINDNWSEPYKLDSTINSNDHEFFPSCTEKGNLYFTRENPATRQGFVYKSEWKNGHFQQPVKLPEQVNCGTARFNPFVSKDESFIIIPCAGMPDSFGGVDYYISFINSDKKWSNPVNMGDLINTEGSNEYSAAVSPDGKFFFFMRAQAKVNTPKITFNTLLKMHNSPENGNSNIYWINADFIENLKEKATFN